MSKALIVGAGEGLSASLARKLAARGYDVILAARNTEKLTDIVADTGAKAVACDASDEASMDGLFAAMDEVPGNLAVAIYNPSGRARGPVTDLDREAVKQAMLVTAYGAFLMAQLATQRMLQQKMEDGKRGALLFTGASAGVKGFPRSSSFAMGKFALRGLCQSLARELHPQGIHVGHFVIDGGIENRNRPERISPEGKPHSMLDPDAIAESYLHLLDQHPSSWSWEMELRPYVESF